MFSRLFPFRPTVPPSLSIQVRYGSNSDWNALKREEQERRDEKWKEKRRGNPFIRNVGAATQLRGLKLHPDNPVLEESFRRRDDLRSTNPDPEFLMMEVLERAGQLERSIQGKVNPMDGDRLARVIHNKKWFPEPKEPLLLTWMEKEVMKHLHSKDPVEWSTKALADAFPATEKVIKKVLSNKGMRFPPSKIRIHDSYVKKNWKMLSEGNLEISPELKQHILEQQSSTDQEEILPRPLLKQVEEKVIEKFKKSQVPNLYLDREGKFGSIISDYKKKVEAKAVLDSGGSLQDLKAPPPMFSPASEFDPASGDVPSAWRETALLEPVGRVDQKKEKLMTVGMFRHAFLQRENENLEGVTENRKVLDKWLDKETNKDRRVTRPKKLSASQVIEEEDTNDIFKVKKWK